MSCLLLKAPPSPLSADVINRSPLAQLNYQFLQVCQRSERTAAAIVSHIGGGHSAAEKAAAEKRRVYGCKKWTLQWLDNGNDLSMRYASY